MKINNVFIFICTFLITLVKNARGGLVSGLEKDVHSTIHKLNEDVYNISLAKYISNHYLIVDNKQEEIKGDEVDTINLNDENKGSKIVIATTEKTQNVNNYDYETEKKQGTAGKSIAFKTASSDINLSQRLKRDTISFGSGCLPRHKRTSDGRCVPSLEPPPYVKPGRLTMISDI